MRGVESKTINVQRPGQATRARGACPDAQDDAMVAGGPRMQRRVGKRVVQLAHVLCEPALQGRVHGDAAQSLSVRRDASCFAAADTSGMRSAFGQLCQRHNDDHDDARGTRGHTEHWLAHGAAAQGTQGTQGRSRAGSAAKPGECRNALFCRSAGGGYSNTV